MAADHLIDLKSEPGLAMLNDVFHEGQFNQPLVQGIFSKQIGRSNCGIQSCALLMGAAQLGQSGTRAERPGSRFDPPLPEAKMFDYGETLKVTTKEQVAKEGLSLKSVVDIFREHRFSVNEFYASDTNVEEFRNKAKMALANGDSQTGVVVNYLMSTLGQGETFGGHHSPLGAYHKQTDRFLILDTWPDTEECWAKADDIFTAMNTIDTSTGKSRGFCVVKF